MHSEFSLESNFGIFQVLQFIANSCPNDEFLWLIGSEVTVQGTASEAAVVALLAARSRALAGRPHEDHVRLVAYTSDQASASIKCQLGSRLAHTGQSKLSAHPELCCLGACTAPKRPQ